jgi:hypothetical protein
MSIYMPMKQRIDREWQNRIAHWFWAGRIALGSQKRVRHGRGMPGYAMRAFIIVRRMPPSWLWSNLASVRRVNRGHRRKKLRPDCRVVPPRNR